jgi:hypothetical protein
VTKLVEGFETPFGLELLATTHWVMTKERAETEEEVVEAVYAWGPRKAQFSRKQIGIAVERLRSGVLSPARRRPGSSDAGYQLG